MKINLKICVDDKRRERNIGFYKETKWIDGEKLNEHRKEAENRAKVRVWSRKVKQIAANEPRFADTVVDSSPNSAIEKNPPTF